MAMGEVAAVVREAEARVVAAGGAEAEEKARAARVVEATAPVAQGWEEVAATALVALVGAAARAARQGLVQVFWAEGADAVAVATARVARA